MERLNKLPDQREAKEVSELPQAPYDLVVKDLSFQYGKNQKEVLTDLNLTIKRGQKLAILGRSGSGKSTLANLLRGDLKPTKGQITLGGVDVSVLNEQMADYIGVIQQAPYLFNTTLINNVRLGNEDASPEDVWAVLERVGLKKMVASLPKGLETMVDEAGLRFSGGERHRLALARILLQDTPIVLLDEPTVGLDPVTEQALITTFMEQLQGKTLIWITHHLKGIEQVDKVIFIEDGQLEMEGSPEELAKTSPRYQKLKAIDDGRL